MIWGIIWLVANTISIIAVGYAVYDSYKEYIISVRENGWYVIAARAEFRSQCFRLTKVLLLFSIAIIALIWPTPPDLVSYRPMFIQEYIKLALTGVVIILTIDSVMSRVAKRKALKSE